MKKTLIFSLILILTNCIVYAGLYSGGEGTEIDPYVILTPEDLVELSNTTDDWDKHFIMLDDIYFPEDETTFDWSGDGVVNSTGKDSLGFSPIGKSRIFGKDTIIDMRFSGTFFGVGVTINNLYINRADQDTVGLFGGISSSTIRNIGLVNCTIIGGQFVGGIAAYSSAYSEISDCSIINSNILGTNNVGSLVGCNLNRSLITNCFANNCDVYGAKFVGGLCAYNSLFSRIENSYSIANVYQNSGDSDLLAGFLGASYNGNINNCYSVSNVFFEEGDSTNRGFCAIKSDGSFRGNFFDSIATNQKTDKYSCATPKTTEEMRIDSTFIDAGWDLDSIWYIDETLNDGYPSLFANINTYRFYIKDYTPTDNEKYAPIDEPIILEFIMDLSPQLGYISLYKEGDILVEKFELNNNVTIEENKLVLQPSEPLEYHTNYYLLTS